MLLTQWEVSPKTKRLIHLLSLNHSNKYSQVQYPCIYYFQCIKITRNRKKIYRIISLPSSHKNPTYRDLEQVFSYHHHQPYLCLSSGLLIKIIIIITQCNDHDSFLAPTSLALVVKYTCNLNCFTCALFPPRLFLIISIGIARVTTLRTFHPKKTMVKTRSPHPFHHCDHAHHDHDDE